MPRTPKHDPEFLSAALIGLQHTLTSIEQRIADLRSRLGGQPVPAPGVKRRTMNAAARRRIGLAQKKRWAAYHAAKTKPAASKPPKRVMSAEGRARIIAATKKRWAAFHKAQRAPKAVAKKKKRVTKKPPVAVAPPPVTATASAV